jgi:hypothetical protein
MTEWLLKREAKKVRTELKEVRDRIATVRRTYEELEKIAQYIRAGAAT